MKTLKTVLSGITLFCLYNVSAQHRMQVYLRQFCCDHTTEHGADEVYFIVTGMSNKGQEMNVRKPGTSLHWDMNDGAQPIDNPWGDSHCITMRNVCTVDIDDGETWDINIALCEEDGGTTKLYQEIASELLVEIGDPFAVGAGTLLGALTELGVNVRDSDDWMGMIGVRVTNNGGRLSVAYHGKDGIVSGTRDPDDPGNMSKAEFRMNHDDSNYVIWLGVR